MAWLVRHEAVLLDYTSDKPGLGVRLGFSFIEIEYVVHVL